METHDLLSTTQDQLESEDLAGFAAPPTLEVETFLRDLDDEVIADRTDVAVAETGGGGRGTPTFSIGKPRHSGPLDIETLERALETSRATVGVPDGL